MKTYRPKPEEFKRKTYLVDAQGKTLGRLATQIATTLMGKGKVIYSPDMLCGDRVVVINAEKVHVTGKKKKDKLYTHFTGFKSGLKTRPYEDLLTKKPREIILRAVSRMLPKNKLRDKMLTSLRVYVGPQHREQSHKPVPLES